MGRREVTIMPRTVRALALLSLLATLRPAGAVVWEQIISRENPLFNPPSVTMTVGRDGLVYLACYRPHHQVGYANFGRDYRGFRSERYTYCRDRRGPWLLFDHLEDPYQLHNLVGYQTHRALVDGLDLRLDELLERRGDPFETGDEVCARLDILLSDEGEVVCGRGYKSAKDEAGGR